MTLQDTERQAKSLKFILKTRDNAEYFKNSEQRTAWKWCYFRKLTQKQCAKEMKGKKLSARWPIRGYFNKLGMRQEGCE